MKLCVSSLKESEWEQKGYKMPAFDVAKMREKTIAAPVWIHFGAGNIFRAFPAALMQKLLDEGKADRGIIACEGFDSEIIEKIYRPFDNLGVLVTLNPDGSMEKKVIASIAEAFGLDAKERLSEIFTSPSLQMASFTITEKGYVVQSGNDFLPHIKEDIRSGPGGAKSLMGVICALCFERYKAGGHPLALVSMDNCSQNGEKLKAAVLKIACEWEKNGFVPKGFLDYLESSQISFPWSMIDKITPRPDSGVKEVLENDGVCGMDIVKTSKNTYIAPFANAEKAEYLVIEDSFPNGRPALEFSGVYFTSRETVECAEKMKVCTCLNPLHTALAVFGCLLSYQTIHEEMKNPVLNGLVRKIGYEEGLPVVCDPGIIKPEEFLREVLEERLPNPFMPDSPQRIATDTSQKIPIRFGETIKAYMKKGLDPAKLTYIPLVFAGWLRYLLGVNDKGEAFEISPDPMLEVLKARISYLKLGENGDFEAVLHPILSNETIFGVDLYKAGLAEKVISYFSEFMKGPGAVETCLIKSRANECFFCTNF